MKAAVDTANGLLAEAFPHRKRHVHTLAVLTRSYNRQCSSFILIACMPLHRGASAPDGLPPVPALPIPHPTWTPESGEKQANPYGGEYMSLDPQVGSSLAPCTCPASFLSMHWDHAHAISCNVKQECRHNLYPFLVSAVVPRPIALLSTLSKEVSGACLVHGMCLLHGGILAAVAGQWNRSQSMAVQQATAHGLLCDHAGHPQPGAILLLQCHVHRPGVEPSHALYPCSQFVAFSAERPVAYCSLACKKASLRVRCRACSLMCALEH
jgi:hypothetical protein